VEQSAPILVSCSRHAIYAGLIGTVAFPIVTRMRLMCWRWYWFETRPAPDASRGTALHSGDNSAGAATKRTQGGKSQIAKASNAKVQNKDRDMGAALRTVYQKTVDEHIPAEMLDLLGKLD
jgi:hypothetical protein